MTRTTPWAEVSKEVRNRPGAKERLEELRAETLAEMTLAQLRDVQGVTQSKLAEVMEATQPAISKIEHNHDLFMSTLQRYVEALGGRLEILAVFDDDTYAITETTK